ncbi:major facilitator superfamily domain-containing protein [Roridomyces roridus]|uniref:Major facilitator superfamily domain-containing protein n=1 Tax=Roridomyces roridus TaxID=1738132 RepID=A0AAD7BCJ5_9AGAR|nr:major facilitator superfamily domain-containing protein [Roridomyces roridus]
MDDTSPSSSPTPPPRSALRGFAIAATCTAAMVVNNANNTSVAIALPSIGMDLRAHATTLQWLVSAYALSSGCLLVFFGHIADVHGRKRVFLGGSVVLAAFTLGCGFAQSQNAMIVLRTLQGVGGAATIPAAIGILAHNFPPSAGRAHAIAFASLAAGGPLGAALGMVLGGLLTQLTSDTWRAQFFLTAGLTVLTLVAGMLFFPNDAPPSFSPTAAPPPHKTDWLGVFLSTTGLVLLVFSLGQGADGSWDWPPPDIIALLALSIVLLGMFALWEMYLSRPRSSRTKNSFLAWAEAPPLLPPALFARGRGRVGAMYLVALLQFGAFMTWAFWVQLYYQIYIGLTPVGTVVKLIPMFVTGILCNLLVAIIAGRIPTGWLLTAGTLTTTIAPLLFTLIIPSASYWAFGFPAAVCVVVGVDFLFSAGMMFVASSVEPGEQSVAGGMFQTMTQLGTSFGVTASTIVFNHVQQWDANGGEGALKSYHAAMWTGVAFGGLAAIVAFVAFWGVRVQPPGPPPSVGPTPAHHENLVAESRSRSGDEGRDSDSRVAQALEKSKRRGDGEQV